MDVIVNGKNLKDVGNINVILGKNGSGKSSVLRDLDQQHAHWRPVKYITPERGGRIAYEPSVENNMSTNPGWFENTRRQNHDEYFRQKSIVLLKQLETLVNRKVAQASRNGTTIEEYFDDVLENINSLLDNIRLEITDKPVPEFKSTLDGSPRAGENLSSGEKELISLAIEVLHFIYTLGTADTNALLLLDEPDVHLHPDLQHRFIKLLVESIKNKSITVIIATHSTAILGALCKESPASKVCFLKAPGTEIQFRSISESLKEIIPIFGAHPLSNIFNENPILLVEGEDDERIWQQAVRSSEGRIKLWPCQATTIARLSEYEDTASQLISSVYEHAKAFSLRDRDTDPYEITDKLHVIRFRLNCYAAENLILSDDVLVSLGTTWEQMQAAIIDWLTKNETHDKFALMQDFMRTFDRRNAKIKDLRLILIDLAGSSKPWEVVIGQAISQLTATSNREEGSLADFLGEKIVAALNLCA